MLCVEIQSRRLARVWKDSKAGLLLGALTTQCGHLGGCSLSGSLSAQCWDSSRVGHSDPPTAAAASGGARGTASAAGRLEGTGAVGDPARALEVAKRRKEWQKVGHGALLYWAL